VLGWRSCFYVGVPIAVVAIAVLQRTLHLPRRRRAARLDYPGALLIAGAVSSLLVWVSLAGLDYAWLSWQTAVLVGAGAALGLAAVLVERRAAEPLVPLRLFAERAVVVAVIASVAVGIAMFGTSVFLSQYMQIARGKSPTESGLLTIPMVVGLFAASTLIGRRITRTGVYKRWMLAGAVVLTLGLALMGTMDEHTSLLELAVFMALVGAGVGMLMQNLVLVVQNGVAQRDMGAGSSLIAFFRSLGGAIGVSALGAILASRVSASIAHGLAALGVQAPAASGGEVPDVASLPAPVARVVEHAYGKGIADVFLAAAPLGLVALVTLLFLREVPLGSRSGIELAQERAPASRAA
jgi:MFS family permease